MTTLVGNLTRLHFHRDNFVIARLRVDAEAGGQPDDGDEDVVVSDGDVAIKGTMISPQISARYTLKGKWETHPKFGAQFSFTSYEVSYPTHEEGVVSYLKELPGLGSASARNIVRKFGAKENPAAAIEALRSDPGKVSAAVARLTLPNAQKASAQLREQEETEGAVLEIKHLLGGTQIGKPAIKRILSEWGKNAPDQIRKDPYSLTDIHGIGFHSADQVARRLPEPHKVGLEDAARVTAGMAHVLGEAAADGGHTCVPVRAFAAMAAELLGVPDETILGFMALAHTLGKICVIVEGHEPDPPDGGHVYHPRLMKAEFDVARHLVAMMEFPMKGTPEPVIDGLAADQRHAVHLAAEKPVILLTGAPGTGKTHALKAIIETFRGRRVELCAPTGKAAKRMTEATGSPAHTIHAMLKPAGRPKSATGAWGFKHNEDAPLDADVVICDETSMVDASLMRSLVVALKPSTRLILVGDSNQLPSVGAGNILAELVASGVVPHVELKTIKRQDPGLIVTNCHRIKDGQQPIWSKPGEVKASDDFFFLAHNDTGEIRSRIIELVADELPYMLDIHKGHNEAEPAKRLEALRAIQVISPLRSKTELGCDSLSPLLQDALNPTTPDNAAPAGVSWGRSGAFRVGDKLIQVRNDYQLGAINGDIGYLREFLPRGEDGGDGQPAILVSFEAPDRTLAVPARKNDLQLAYALTCHKYQGSEAPAIVIPMHRCFGGLIVQRNWVYTALSRAQRFCLLVGQPEALRRGVRRTGQAKRCSRLAAHLRRGVLPTPILSAGGVS